MAKSITLFMDDGKGGEVEKTFHQPTRIKGSVLKEAFKIDEKMLESRDSGPTIELLDEMYQFVAEYAYNNQFTASEYEDGMDARDILEETQNQIASVISRSQGGSSGKSTKAKKA